MTYINRGFTLIELMVAVAIIAILMSFAYPSYINQVNSSRRAEAISALVTLASDQERFYTTNSFYAATVAQIASAGFNEPEYYTITVTNNDPITVFTLTATPNGWADAVCDVFTLTNVGVRGVTGDFDENNNPGEAADIIGCWN